MAFLGLLVAILVVPTTGLPEAVARPTAAASPRARCAAALSAVHGRGLLLPAGFEYRCPGDTRSFPGDRQHWGVTCYGHMFCPSGAYIATSFPV